MQISSINLSKINKAVTGVTETVRKSKLLIDDISEKIGKTNERIKTKISTSAKLFQRRQQAIRRKVREDLIEASGIGGAMRRVNKVVSTSTRGFLGRILDFVATILVGWAIVNLPKIVKLAENLFKRLNKFFKIITGFTDGLVEYFNKFTTELSAIGSNLSQIDLQGVGDQMTNIVTRLQKAFKRMENGFIREVLGFTRMSDKDLVDYFNADIEKEEREQIDKNIEKQLDPEKFDDLPENLQNAVRLLMSENEELKLDAYQIGIIESGNREKLLQLLREDANIIPVEGEDGSTSYRRREDGEGDFSILENLIEKENENKKSIDDLNKRINELEKKNDNDNLIDKNIKDRNIGNGEESKTLIYLKNQKKILNQEKREAINTYYNNKYNGGFSSFGSGVNSNERLINDMNLQKIKD